MGFDSEVKRQIRELASSEKAAEVELELLGAVSSVYGINRIYGLDNEVSLRSGLAMIMDSLGNYLEFEGRRIKENGSKGLPARNMYLERARLASEELRGFRKGKDYLRGMMPIVSAMAREYETADHMDDLGMPGGLLGRIAFHLQFDQDKKRRIPQLEYIHRVEKFVLENSPKWVMDGQVR